MTMPAFRPNRRAPDAPGACAQKKPKERESPGILGFQASDADAISILPVPRSWDDWDGGGMG